MRGGGAYSPQRRRDRGGNAEKTGRHFFYRRDAETLRLEGKTESVSEVERCALSDLREQRAQSKRWAENARDGSFHRRDAKTLRLEGKTASAPEGKRCALSGS